jgi:hypothetical protein
MRTPEKEPSVETLLQLDELFELLEEAAVAGEVLLQADDLPVQLRHDLEDITTRTHLSALRASLWARRFRWVGFQ